jgi:hypothetical protein
MSLSLLPAVSDSQQDVMERTTIASCTQARTCNRSFCALSVLLKPYRDFNCVVKLEVVVLTRLLFRGDDAQAKMPRLHDMPNFSLFHLTPTTPPRNRPAPSHWRPLPESSRIWPLKVACTYRRRQQAYPQWPLCPRPRATNILRCQTTSFRGRTRLR